jgi:hypothetical protein
MVIGTNYERVVCALMIVTLGCSLLAFIMPVVAAFSTGKQ